MSSDIAPNTALLVGTFLSPALGARSVCEDLAQRLASRGWHVVTTSSRIPRLAKLIDMVSTAWFERHHYNVGQVDVYSGPAFLWAETVCWVLRRARKPYILSLHGGNLPGFARRHPHRVRRLLRSASAVTTPSGYLLDKLKHLRDDLRLLPNGLDLNAFEFFPRKAPSPRLIWVRAFHEIYNPALAAQVVARLAPEFPDIELTMLGRDKGDGALERFKHAAAALGIERRIHIAGGVPRKDVPRWLKQAGVFLNTTNVDNAPVSVLEALACGLPVVSTGVGGIPYLLENGRDGLIVPPGDPDAMASAVRRILTEPGLAEALSRNGRSKAEQVDWSVVMPQWQELLASQAVSK